MTDPRRYLIRMIIFLAIVAEYCRPALGAVAGAFMGNPALNGVILGALLLGIIYVIRQTLRLSPEQRWLVGVQKNGNKTTKRQAGTAGNRLCHAGRPESGGTSVGAVPAVGAGWRCRPAG